MTIKIGPIDFIVKDVTDLRDEDGAKLDGSLLHGSCEILLEKSLHPQIKQMTLWHEIIHAILVQAGRREDGQNEGLIDSLAYGIAAVLRRNKEIK